MSIENFNEFVNDIHPAVEIMGVTLGASDILKSCNPIAYRQEYLIFIQWRVNEGERGAA